MTLVLVIVAVWVVALTPVFALARMAALADRDAQRLAGRDHDPPRSRRSPR